MLLQSFLLKSSIRQLQQRIAPWLSWQDTIYPSLGGPIYGATCRNTKIGPLYITDERGYTCLVQQVRAGHQIACCPTNSPQYACQNCLSTCCSTLAFCVSCCMGQNQYQRDPFSWCLQSCRTNSKVLVHQNAYISAQYHFCFGDIHVDPSNHQQDRFSFMKTSYKP
eukprot:jgi/Galph1/1881/GphlegSOOS_G563.1